MGPEPDPVGAAAGAEGISVIVASYNSRSLLERCLESLYAHPVRRPFEVLVADDASTDGSAEMVRRRFPRARLRVNPRNLGYARSNNRAMAESRGRFIYLLNSDAIVMEGALDALADFLEREPAAGAAGTLLYNADGSVQASVKALPSARSALFGKRSLLARWLPDSRLTRAELLQWRAGEGVPFRAGYVSSASLMIRREVCERVGELDTRLWHFIDADYCKRIWDSGWAVYCVPSARAVHLDHQGGTMADWRKRFRTVRTFHYGAYVYHTKHSGMPWWHPVRAGALAGLGARFVASLAFQAVKEIIGVDERIYRRGR